MLNCFNTRVRASVKARARRAARVRAPMPNHNRQVDNRPTTEVCALAITRQLTDLEKVTTARVQPYRCLRLLVDGMCMK